MMKITGIFRCNFIKQQLITIDLFGNMFSRLIQDPIELKFLKNTEKQLKNDPGFLENVEKLISNVKHLLWKFISK